MENNYYVYEWIRLDTNEPFYVGKGKNKRCYKLTRGDNHHFNDMGYLGFNLISILTFFLLSYLSI